MYNATTSSFEQCDYFINHEIRISSLNNQYTTVNILRFVRIRKRIIRIHIFIGIPIRIISYILRIPIRSIRIPKSFFPWHIVPCQPNEFLQLGSPRHRGFELVLRLSDLGFTISLAESESSRTQGGPDGLKAPKKKEVTLKNKGGLFKSQFS